MPLLIRSRPEHDYWICVCLISTLFTRVYQGFMQDCLLGGGNVFSHASTKHVNVGGLGASPQDFFFKLSFSEVDFSAILLCVHVYTAMHNFSIAVKSCRCERE